MAVKPEPFNEEERRLLREEGQIPAVKAYKDRLNCSLKEAFDAMKRAQRSG